MFYIATTCLRWCNYMVTKYYKNPCFPPQDDADGKGDQATIAASSSTRHLPSIFFNLPPANDQWPSVEASSQQCLHPSSDWQACGGNWHMSRDKISIRKLCSEGNFRIMTSWISRSAFSNTIQPNHVKTWILNTTSLARKVAAAANLGCLWGAQRR